jgi:Uma2 family endonuclease
MASTNKSRSYRNEAAQNATSDFMPAPRRFTVGEYYKMAEAGVLRENERVELIEGEIIVMSPQGPKHASSSSRATEWFILNFTGRFAVRAQMPIHLDDSSEPEPDIVLALPDENYYSDHHPTPKEILLVMEVSDSTLEFDRVRKSHTYAKAGIRQYCVLNLKTRELEDYRAPGKDGYRSKQTYTAGESFTLAAFPKISVKVAELLPPVKSAKRHKSRSK